MMLSPRRGKPSRFLADDDASIECTFLGEKNHRLLVGVHEPLTVRTPPRPPSSIRSNTSTSTSSGRSIGRRGDNSSRDGDRSNKPLLLLGEVSFSSSSREQGFFGDHVRDLERDRAVRGKIARKDASFRKELDERDAEFSKRIADVDRVFRSHFSSSSSVLGVSV